MVGNALIGSHKDSTNERRQKLSLRNGVLPCRVTFDWITFDVILIHASDQFPDSLLPTKLCSLQHIINNVSLSNPSLIETAQIEAR